MPGVREGKLRGYLNKKGKRIGELIAKGRRVSGEKTDPKREGKTVLNEKQNSATMTNPGNWSCKGRERGRLNRGERWESKAIGISRWTDYLKSA